MEQDMYINEKRVNSYGVERIIVNSSNVGVTFALAKTRGESETQIAIIKVGEELEDPYDSEIEIKTAVSERVLTIDLLSMGRFAMVEILVPERMFRDFSVKSIHGDVDVLIEKGLMVNSLNAFTTSGFVKCLTTFHELTITCARSVVVNTNLAKDAKINITMKLSKGPIFLRLKNLAKFNVHSVAGRGTITNIKGAGEFCLEGEIYNAVGGVLVTEDP